MRQEDYLSPDGQLRLLVTALDGDVTIGFEGCAWHTHGDILAALYGQNIDSAVKRFVSEVIDGK